MQKRLEGPFARHPALIIGAAAILVAVLSMPVWTVEPEFDAWVWLIWGRELNGLDLTTNAGEFAIAWKPLPVLVDAILAFAGDGASDLWVVLVRATAIVALALAFVVGRRLAGAAAGVVAVVAPYSSSQVSSMRLRRRTPSPFSSPSRSAPSSSISPVAAPSRSSRSPRPR